MDKILTLTKVTQKNLKGLNLEYIAYQVKESKDLYLAVTESCDTAFLDLDMNKVLKLIKNEPELYSPVLVAINKNSNLTFQVAINEGHLPLLLLQLDPSVINKSRNKKELLKFSSKACDLLSNSQEIQQSIRNIFNFEK